MLDSGRTANVDLEALRKHDMEEIERLRSELINSKTLIENQDSSMAQMQMELEKVQTEKKTMRDALVDKLKKDLERQKQHVSSFNN